MNSSSQGQKNNPTLATLQGPWGMNHVEQIMSEQKPKRKSMSKKLRFDVFKRDSFTCQYCGSHPPKVVLHVDHINPVSNGGENDIDNLITACDCCNFGKGARLLSDIPQSLKDKAAELAEREEQIAGYNAILLNKMNRIENESWDIAGALEGQDFIESYSKQDRQSIKKFLERLPFPEVLDAAISANAKFSRSGPRKFKYFCGICWAKIRECSNG